MLAPHPHRGGAVDIDEGGGLRVVPRLVGGSSGRGHSMVTTPSPDHDDQFSPRGSPPLSRASPTLTAATKTPPPGPPSKR